MIRGKSHFEDGIVKNYLVFQPIYRCFKKIGNSKHKWVWKSKGLCDKSIKPSTTSNNNLSPLLNYIGTKMQVKFDGSCLTK